MKHNFIGKSKFLNAFFLRSNRLEKINLEWAYQNKDILQNYYREAFEMFFPAEAQQEYDETEEDLQDLRNSCGRDR